MRIFLRKIRSTGVASVYTNPENALAFEKVQLAYLSAEGASSYTNICGQTEALRHFRE